MVALGCKYLRICHLNNCATGVATQHELLRRNHFVGLPEMVENFFRFIAEDVRQWLARLGVRAAGGHHRPHRPARAHRRAAGRPGAAGPGAVAGARGRRRDMKPYCIRTRNPVRETSALVEAHPGRHRRRRRRAQRRALRLRHPQRRPRGRRAPVRRHRPAVGRPRHGRRADHPGTDRQRRAEPGRLERRRPAHRPDRRGQRLRRQGHGRRPHRAAPAGGCRLRQPRGADPRQHLPVRRHRRRAVRRRHRRRAFRRAQLRRAGRGRGRRRPLLRIHDRRRGRWCWAAPASTSAPA